MRPTFQTHRVLRLTPSPRLVVLATYRHLLRATGLAFRGDDRTLTASRATARNEFLANAQLQPGGNEASLCVEKAQGVTKILRENVVQGTLKEGHKETYKLKIHEHTQKLDNETTKLGKGTVKSFKQIKDSQF